MGVCVCVLSSVVSRGTGSSMECLSLYPSQFMSAHMPVANVPHVGHSMFCHICIAVGKVFGGEGRSSKTCSISVMDLFVTVHNMVVETLFKLIDG